MTRKLRWSEAVDKPDALMNRDLRVRIDPRTRSAVPLVRIGCAGWSLPRATASAFPAEGSHLERYASVFKAAEINSSFYRSHQFATYARWSASVPECFRFSVKLPRQISHDARLRGCARPLTQFLGEIAGLGSRLGVILMQFPPGFAFDRKIVRSFLVLLRRRYDGAAVAEPRHISWFTEAAEDLLREFDVGRVGSDPALCIAAATPGADLSTLYWRLHGSPRMYYSSYEETDLTELVDHLAAREPPAQERWCIFDNTAHGHATANALKLEELMRGRPLRLRSRSTT